MSVRFVLFVLVAVGFLGISSPAEAADKPVLVADMGHSFTVTSVTCSPNGKWIVTGSDDSTAIIWEAANGQQLRTLRGHTSRVWSVTYSPDGKQIVTGSRDGTAIVWDAANGEQLRTLQGNRASIRSVTYSPNSKRIVTGGADGKAIVWDAATGEKLLTLQGHTSTVTAATYSSDGQRVVTGSEDQTAIVWDAATGAKLRTLQGHTGFVLSVTYSPDGKQIATGSADKTAIIWDASTGEKLRTLQDHTDAVWSVAYSPDGKRIVTGSHDKTAIVWVAATGAKLHTLKGHVEEVNAVTYSLNGKRIVTGGGDSRAMVWDAATGKRLLFLQGHTGVGWGKIITSVSYSPDGKRIVTGSYDKTATVWDMVNGAKLRKLQGHKGFVLSVMYRPDGKRIAAGSEDKTAIVWNAATGAKSDTFQGHSGAILAVTYSPDSKRMVSGSKDQTAIVWDAKNAAKLLILKGHSGNVESITYSPDGQQIVTGSADKTAIIWDASTGAKRSTLEGHTNLVRSVAFRPDGKQIVTGSWDRTAIVWDAATGSKLRILQGHTNGVQSVAYSPDGKRIVTASYDSTAIVWDAATGEKLRTLQGHGGGVNSVIYSPDGKWIITGSSDGSTRQWDAETGKELCQMIYFADGTWAVIDPAGRFDASNGGDVKGLHWVVGLEPIALKQLKERYYDPGLLAKHFGFNKERLREVKAFTSVELYPALAVTQADPKIPQFDVALTNRGGGIGRVVVLVNGKELTADARPRGAADANAAKLATRLDLTNDPRLMPGKKNKVVVLAYNSEGYLSSRGLVREFDAPGKMATDRPTLHAVVVGISKYDGDKLNLRYAAKDAEDFAAALRLAGTRLFGTERVHLTVLTAEAEKRPSRANLVKALEALKATKPGDLVVVYLAGHGVMHGGQDGDWYYLTADAQKADFAADPEIRKQVSLSSRELTELLKAAPAQKQVLILDTCHAGRVVEKLTEKRDVPGSQVRALERVKDRTGMHVLAGCAADSLSYEASRYGQGILTYSLLLGMRGAKLREGEYVDIVDLFSFAADKVPELARDIGGVQRPTIASPRGASFDIGRLTADDRSKVPLQSVKPVVLRAVFQLEKVARDSLGLSKRINDRLREASATSRGATLVYVDADEFPGGIQPSGRYKIVGDKVTVSVSLFEGDKETAAFTAEGAAGQPDELAGKIAAELEKRIALSSGK